MSWTRLRVDYHGGPMDPLILDGLRPAIEGRRAYFVRHWVRGPHLRVYVDGPAGPVADGIRRYLAEHPSVGADAEALLPLHRRLAELEDEPGPLTPWQPDNTVTQEPVEPRDDLGAFLADCYAAATPAAFDALERVRAGTPLPSLAFDLVVATAQRLSEGGLAASRRSLRSHAEAYLARQGGVRARWQAQYLANRDALTARVAAITGGAWPAGTREWVDLLTPLRDRGRALVDQGRIKLEYGTAAAAPGLPPLTEVSGFHRALEDDAGWLELRDSPGFATYRLVLNCTYLHLTRLGLTPDRRFLVCYLAACAADDALEAVAR